MATKEPGYVYILTNPSFREDWVKIGKSSRPELTQGLSPCEFGWRDEKDAARAVKLNLIMA